MIMPDLFFESEGTNYCYVWGNDNGYEVDDDPERIQTPFLNIKIYMLNENDDKKHLMTIKGRLCMANESDGESLFEVCDLVSGDLAYAAYAVGSLEDDTVSAMYYIESYELFEQGISPDFLNDIFPLLFKYIYYTEHVSIHAITLIENSEDGLSATSFPMGVPDCFIKINLSKVRFMMSCE